MKSVLISIKPKWCELIASGKKTVEVRKTKPKIDTPFKVYIYETKALYKGSGGCLFNGRGKVIGEFVCKKIDKIVNRGIHNNFDYCYCSLDVFGNDDIEIEITDIKNSCISKEELNYYGMYSHCLYAWHISDLVIYDKPKELSEFHKVGYTETKESVTWLTRDEEKSWQISRPPQSWCYVESQ